MLKHSALCEGFPLSNNRRKSTARASDVVNHLCIKKKMFG